MYSRAWHWWGAFFLEFWLAYGVIDSHYNTFFIFAGFYFTGDGALRDKDGDYRITGRMDDVINVSGKRLGTAEIEDAMVTDDCSEFFNLEPFYIKCSQGSLSYHNLHQPYKDCHLIA